MARVAITSLAFMFELVPDPVWNTSTGNWASCAPAATSSAAAAIAAARSSASTPIRPLTRAAAALTSPSARICARSRPRPEIGKFSTARCVCARHNASAGTRTSPMVSGVHAPVRQLLSPNELSQSSFICRDGLRRSASINKTLRPMVAKCLAMQVDVNDFPSPGPALVIDKELGKPFSVENSIDVQSDR